MDEWENGLPDEYEQEEISEQGRRDLAAERQEALELELEQGELRQTASPNDPPAKKKLKRETEQEALARLESAAQGACYGAGMVCYPQRRSYAYVGDTGVQVSFSP